MECNSDKCELMHFGKSNQSWTSIVCGWVLESVESKETEGYGPEPDKVEKKVFGMLTFIGVGIEYRSWGVGLQSV